MMRKRVNNTDSFTVSFLDVASCGFGAMIILLMLAKPSQPEPLEDAEIAPAAVISELQEQLFDIRGVTRIVNRELNAKREQLSAVTQRIARLRRDLSEVQGNYQSSNQLSVEAGDELGELYSAQQRLSEDVLRITEKTRKQAEKAVVGIPIDSEYIIFVIDTSGSMYQSANWGLMLSKVEEALGVYPALKGIQVMNDKGQYMFPSFQRKWIPDSPERRNQILSTLRNWIPFSESNPLEGISIAIRDFYEPGRSISLYVMGDDFQAQGNTIAVINAIDLRNRADDEGNRLVRIHAIGFPLDQRVLGNADRFADLMREMTKRNGGTFVGL
jgi:hypothetical protein